MIALTQHQLQFRIGTLTKELAAINLNIFTASTQKEIDPLLAHREDLEAVIEAYEDELSVFNQ